MKPVIGVYECKIDSKSRVGLPAALRKQLPEIADGFYLKRAIYKKCLELWPMSEWNIMMEKISALNRFVPENDLFIRKFMAGVKFVEVDDAGRILIAKDLLAYADIHKDLVISSAVKVIEIWDKVSYEKELEEIELKYVALAKKVMAGIE